VRRNPGARIDIGALESTTVTTPPPPPPTRRRGVGAQPLVPGTGTSASAAAAPARVAVSSPPSTAAPTTSAPDVEPVSKPTASLRIEPPILVAWRRLRDWMEAVGDRLER
jgi:hypothetical protein